MTFLGTRKSSWLLAGAVALALTGCNGSDSPANPSQDDPQTSSVTIKRDSYGVPHVYADSTYGLYYGYGYSLAQDRLFQMEMVKRSVLGTVSEVLGPDYLSLDKSSRQGFEQSAIEAQIAELPEEDRDIFEGYAAGFNKRIEEVMAQTDTLLPKQFTDFDFQPSVWTATDVAMLYVGTMAGRYSNSSSEIRNLALLKSLQADLGESNGLAMFDQIRWIQDPLAPTTVPRELGVNSFGSTNETIEEHSFGNNGDEDEQLNIYQSLASVDPKLLEANNSQEAAFKGVITPEDRPTASNLWIIGPNRTADGSTILNNGPQFGNFNPAYVYSIGLHGAGYDVTGNTPFALPVILFGTNNTITWGATAGPLDVNDYYQLQLNPGNQEEYYFDGEYREMEKRTETILVRTDNGMEEETFPIYSSVHGVITSVDQENNTAYAFKRSWKGYEIQSLMGWVHSMKAQNWDEWLAEAENVATTINWYYADSSGNIGYVSPGYLPIRPDNQDIRLPAVGDGSMEWQGFRPFEDVPKVYNPSQGFITNWNNQSAPTDAALGDGANWSVADRVNELTKRIEANPQMSPEEVWGLLGKTSYSDPNARYFVPFILDAVDGAALPENSPVLQAANRLRDWNLRADPDDSYQNYIDPSVTIFRLWLQNMINVVLADDISQVTLSTGYGGYVETPGTGVKLLINALLGDEAGVPQEFDFLNGQVPNEVVFRVFEDTVSQLEESLGTDQVQWLTEVRGQSFSTNNFLGVPQAGADEVLELPAYMNRGTQNHQVRFADGEVEMCSVAPPGQSGFVSSSGVKAEHYQDQLNLYRDFECKTEWLTPVAVEQAKVSETELTYSR